MIYFPNKLTHEDYISQLTENNKNENLPDFYIKAIAFAITSKIAEKLGGTKVLEKIKSLRSAMSEEIDPKDEERLEELSYDWGDLYYYKTGSNCGEVSRIIEKWNSLNPDNEISYPKEESEKIALEQEFAKVEKTIFGQSFEAILEINQERALQAKQERMLAKESRENTPPNSGSSDSESKLDSPSPSPAREPDKKRVAAALKNLLQGAERN